MKRLLICLLSVFMLCFVGCSDIDQLNGNVSKRPVYPVTVGNVEFNSTPQKVISLSPAVTEILFELGFEQYLIGRSSYCDYPSDALKLEDMGSGANPSKDKIMSSGADLIISNTPLSESDVKDFESAGTRVLMLPPPSSVDELKQYYALIASVFAGTEKAGKMAAEILSPLEELLNSAYYEKSVILIMTPELAVATGDTLAGDIISKLCTNTAADKTGYLMSADEIVKANPDYILLGNKTDFAVLPTQIGSLPAVSGKRAVNVDISVLERPTSRVIEFAQTVCDIINR